VKNAGGFPLITAHSGAEGTPPNSLGFVRKAAAAGADYMELDLRITADGVPVFHHDPVIRGSDGTVLKVAFCDYRSLREASSGRLAKGSDILAAVRESGTAVHLDMKDPAALGITERILKDLNLADRTLLSGLHRDQAAEIRRDFPDLGVMLNLDYELDEAARIGQLAAEFREGLESARSLGCRMINLEHVRCCEEFVLSAHRAGIGISVWTVEKEKDFRRLIEIAVDSITTDSVSLLRSLRT